MNEELLKEAILRCSEYFLTQGIRIDEQNIEKITTFAKCCPICKKAIKPTNSYSKAAHHFQKRGAL